MANFSTLPPPSRRATNGGRSWGACHRLRWHRLQVREQAVLLVFGCRLVQTLLRMATGALVVYVCEDYECSAASRGWLLSAYAFGYCTTQVLGGQLADRVGGRSVVGLAMGAAGMALAATPAAAAAAGLSGVVACQALMGVATGPLFPASVQLMSRWLRAEDRAVASTVLDTGITVGSFVSLPLSAFLAVHFGWQPTLLFYGAVAVAYAGLWVRLAPRAPARDSAGDPETALAGATAGGRAAAPEAAGANLLEAVRHVQLWAIYWAHFSFNYGVYFVNSWSATYYLEVFGLRPDQAGLHLAIPHLANVAVKLLVNPNLEGLLQSRGCGTLRCRRAFTCSGFLIAAACMLGVPGRSSPLAATALLSLSLGAVGLHPSGFKANYMDVTTFHGGLVSGVGNTIASVASSVGPLLVARMHTSSGSWAPAFTSVAWANVLAALVFGTLSSATPIEDANRLPGVLGCISAPGR